MKLLRRLTGALARRVSPPPTALLRQTDWRFLLPNPEGESWDHVVLLGDSPELARLITESEIAKRVSSEIPPERCADAVVVSLWAVHAITRADRARSLAPTGPDVRQGNAYVTYLGVLARDADRLFQSW